jgi:L-lactate dehydrogenase complex protein LldG
MSGAKEQILDRVRRAVAPVRGDRESEYNAIDRSSLQHGILDADARLTLFEQRLIDYGALVVRCEESELAQTIARTLKARNTQSILIPLGLPKSWLPDSIHFHIDDDLPHEELDRAEGVLTGCALAIAATGTIVLHHSRDEGRRALTLIPDYHLCVVFASQIVETVVEGIRAMASFGNLPLTTASGPSATSDIEMTRIQGVHGPRVLDAILVLNQ